MRLYRALYSLVCTMLVLKVFLIPTYQTIVDR